MIELPELTEETLADELAALSEDIANVEYGHLIVTAHERAQALLTEIEGWGLS